MTTALRIAFLKPEHGVAGGLESVVAELEAIARADGHQVSRLSVDMRGERRREALSYLSEHGLLVEEAGK